MQEHTWSEIEDKRVSSSKFCQYTWALKVMLDLWGISGMGKRNRCRMGEGGHDEGNAERVERDKIA